MPQPESELRRTLQHFGKQSIYREQTYASNVKWRMAGCRGRADPSCPASLIEISFDITLWLIEWSAMHGGYGEELDERIAEPKYAAQNLT